MGLSAFSRHAYHLDGDVHDPQGGEHALKSWATAMRDADTLANAVRAERSACTATAARDLPRRRYERDACNKSPPYLAARVAANVHNSHAFGKIYGNR
eukprot:4128483-Pleurochrysis_carterae.AAC.6